MLTVRSLGSGSSGNSILVDDGATAVLIDCGVPYGTIQQGLAAFSRRVDALSAVLISHEHVDHVRALPKLARERIPIACTAGTAMAAEFVSTKLETIRVGDTLAVGTFSITALPVAHDAVEPCGFQIDTKDARITVVTDTGSICDDLAPVISRSDLVILEANHDIRMLKRGPYPPHLKRRVLSDIGHLSNDACAEVLAVALQRAVKPVTVWLAHLSTTNNRPDLAISTVQRRVSLEGPSHLIEALPRYGLGRVWRSDEEVTGRAFSGQLALPGLL